LTKKDKEKKKDKGTKSESSSRHFFSPWLVTQRILGSSVDRVLHHFEDLRSKLLKSGMKVSFPAYVSFVVFSSLMAFLGTFIAITILGAISNVFGVILLAVAAAVGILLGVATFSFTYYYPSLIADSRKRQLDEELPFAVSQMAVLAIAGIPPERIFRSLMASGYKSAVRDQARDVVRDIDLFGTDFLSAVESARERSPSRLFSDVLDGFLAAVRTGGDLKKYLLSSVRSLMETRRILAKQLIDTLGMLAETYVSLLVVFPITLMIVFSVIAMLSGSLGGISILTIMVLLTYVIIPALAITMIILLDAIIPKE
jgi:flagellar protein FlaJ